MRESTGSGYGRIFLAFVAAGMPILVLLGVAAFYYVPRFLKDADKKVIPWLESKGRILIGKVALHPLTKTIERSELSDSEKKGWIDFLVAKWELASSTQDRKLSRELLINASRETVGTYSGIYYALLAIGDRDFKETSLTKRQIEDGQKLITIVTANMLDGVYSMEELTPMKTDLYSVLTGWRVETQNAKGRREEDNSLRDFFRALNRLREKTETEGDNQNRDMNAEFHKELLAFKQRILQEENAMAVEDDPQN